VPQMQKTKLNHSSQYIAVALLLFACSWVVIFGLKSAGFQKMSPDACMYLDIARNIKMGRGIVTRYNLYQSWIGEKRSALAYQQPAYPLLLALVLDDDVSVDNAIYANTIMATLALIFFFFFFRRYLDDWKAGIALIPFATSAGYYAQYSAPMTEAMSMMFLAAGLYAYSRGGRWWRLAALILGISLLIRASNLFSVAPFVVVIFISEMRKDLPKALKFALIACAPLAIYEIICLATVGEIYPSYGGEARLFRMTRDYGGAIYQNSIPALGFSGRITGDILLKMLYHNVLHHIWEFFIEIGPFLSIFVLAAVVLGVKDLKASFVFPLFAFGIGSIICFSLVFYTLHDLEADRYSINALAVFLPLSIIGVQAIAERLKMELRTSNIVIIALFAFLSFISARETLALWNSEKDQHSNEEIKRVYFHDPANWIHDNTEENDLIATNYHMNAYVFDRPVITLPINRQLERNSLSQFISVHKPKAILLDYSNEYLPKWMNPIYWQFLEEMGYQELRKNYRFVLLVK
jgi:hypothetical protein